MTNNDIFKPTKELSAARLRKAVRYVENESKATITLHQWLSSSEQIAIKIVNISSKGACIKSQQALSLDQKITLNIKLSNGYRDAIKAKVIRLHEDKNYGISFDQTQHELADQIIAQSDQFSISP